MAAPENGTREEKKKRESSRESSADEKEKKSRQSKEKPRDRGSKKRSVPQSQYHRDILSPSTGKMFYCRRDSSSSSSSSSDSSSESSSESSSDSSRSRSRGREKRGGRKAGKEKRKEDKEVPAEKEKVRESSGSKRARSRSGGRKKSSSPPPTKIHIGRLTRNVNKEHLTEIFSTFGKIKDIEFGSERMRPWLNKGNDMDQFDNCHVCPPPRVCLYRVRDRRGRQEGAPSHGRRPD